MLNDWISLYIWNGKLYIANQANNETFAYYMLTAKRY